MAQVDDYIGPYRLLSVVMTGQTSQVWEVIDEGDRSRRAIKLLLSEFRKSKEHVGYLRQEYNVGRTLEHPRIVQIHELVSHQGSVCLVMELFPFPNIKQAVINRGVKAWAHLLPRIITEAAEGLGYMHRKGWVHRDIKPDNYLVTPEGEVKLIDFALAQKASGGGLLARLLAGKQKLQGTRSYMSPEQIRSRPLDARSDIYSFGCFVHELVTGKPPFTGTTSDELLNKHLRAAPPQLTAQERNVTPEFADLVQRMLAKKPEKRPESLEHVLRELGKIRIFRETPRAPA